MLVSRSAYGFAVDLTDYTRPVKVEQLEDAMARAAERGVAPAVLAEAQSLVKEAEEHCKHPLTTRHAWPIANRALAILGEPPTKSLRILREDVETPEQPAPAPTTHPDNNAMRRRIERAKAEGEVADLHALRRRIAEAQAEGEARELPGHSELRNRIEAMRAENDALGEVARSKDLDFSGVLRPGNGRSREEENPRVWRAALHESAHITSAIVDRLPLLGAQINRDGGGHTMIARWATHPAEKRAALLWAGAYAESLLFAGAHSPRSISGDMEMLRAMERELMPDGTNGRPFEETPEVKAAERNAAGLVKAFELPIFKMAAVLFDNVGRLIGERDLRFIHEWATDDPQWAEAKRDLQWRAWMGAKGWPVRG